MTLAQAIVPILITAALIFTAYPLLQSNQPRRVTNKRQQSLREAQDEKDSIIANLRDIEMDFRMGKLDADRYQELRTGLQYEAQDVYRRIRKLSPPRKRVRGSRR